MQNSFGKELTGAQGIATQTSGTAYGIQVGRRYKSYINSNGGTKRPISTTVLNNSLIEMDLHAGDEPTLILMHPRQYSKIMNFLEDRKRYDVKSKNRKNKDIGFSTLHYEGSNGMIPMMKSRFVDSDKILLLNLSPKHACLHLRPEGVHLQRKDGNIWHRLENEDTLQARMAFYGQFFLNPNKQGVITDLSL